jgi:hypothetical protein
MTPSTRRCNVHRLTTPTGRAVIDTGRVLIGLRAGEHAAPSAATQDAQQDVLCHRARRAPLVSMHGAMHPSQWVTRTAANDGTAPRSPAPRVPRDRPGVGDAIVCAGLYACSIATALLLPVALWRVFG